MGSLFVGIMLVFVVLVFLVLPIVYSVYSYIKYKKSKNEMNNNYMMDIENIKNHNIETMLKLGYGELKEVNFDESDKITLKNNFNINITTGSHRININHNGKSIQLEKMDYISSNIKLAVYVINKENKISRFFAQDTDKLKEFFLK